MILNSCKIFLNKNVSKSFLDLLSYVVHLVLNNYSNIGYWYIIQCDCGMFVINYVEYLMHNHPFNSLTSVRMG